MSFLLRPFPKGPCRYLLEPQGGYHIRNSGPTYVLEWYLDPLGCGNELAPKRRIGLGPLDGAPRGIHGTLGRSNGMARTKCGSKVNPRSLIKDNMEQTAAAVRQRL